MEVEEVIRHKTKYCRITLIKLKIGRFVRNIDIIISTIQLFSRRYFFIREKRYRSWTDWDDYYYIMVVPSFKRVPPKNRVEEYLSRALKISEKVSRKFYAPYSYKINGQPVFAITEYDVCLHSNCLLYGLKGFGFSFTDRLVCDYHYENLLKYNKFLREIEEFFLTYMFDFPDDIIEFLSRLLL